MSVKIDKYYIEENNGIYYINDKSYFQHRLIIKFDLENSKKNKRLAEKVLQILNSGRYEWEDLND